MGLYLGRNPLQLLCLIQRQYFMRFTYGNINYKGDDEGFAVNYIVAQAHLDRKRVTVFAPGKKVAAMTHDAGLGMMIILFAIGYVPCVR